MTERKGPGPKTAIETFLFLRDIECPGGVRLTKAQVDALAKEIRSVRHKNSRALNAVRYMTTYLNERGTGTALSIVVARDKMDAVLATAKRKERS